MSEERPYVWQMLREGIDALGPRTTNVALRDWVLRKWPGTNSNTVSAQTTICTVNHPSRVHYPENSRPRPADGRLDFLFRSSRGHLERYDRARHGAWEIAETPEGKRVVRQVAEPTGEPPVIPPGSPPAPGPTEPGAGFAAEDHLRDFLAANLEKLEPGLQVFVGPEGDDGVELSTDVGRIDILGIAANGDLVVVELKVGRGQDAVVGQILRYIGWVRRHLAQGRRVRGIVVAQEISEALRYAIGTVPDVTLKTYALAISFGDVAPHR